MVTKIINKKLSDDERAGQAYDYLMRLGSLTVRLAEVDRALRYPNGDREDDLRHSFHLALSAAELASTYFPELDAGLVSQFSLVHDMPEVYAGDVWTFKINNKERKNKELAEKASLDRLLKELPPHTAQLLSRYERQLEPEARFVRLVDKIMPDVINVLAGEASTFKEDLDIGTAEDLKLICNKRLLELQAMFPEFPLVLIIKSLSLDDLQVSMFK
jgi:5'-deoxynucleotidase YfbR-like HD superfamily hydrolase